ncbi:hypothetical protein [Paraflavitalea pollutisoli]|uniref:hypothetical protein n=1 Tax=Paraflavitalea pollutisoli TaxID=3034143 RepID=UPI0023EB0330|nr:hypothetical protein [Paraflavitalea sp. H1-2-19X]
MGNDTTPATPSADSWTAEQWLKRLTYILLSIILVYVVLHLIHNKGQEYFKLNAKQVQRISSLLLSADTTKKDALSKKTTEDHKGKKPQKTSPDNKNGDSATADTGVIVRPPIKTDTTPKGSETRKPIEEEICDSENPVISFLRIEIGALAATQERDIKNYICQFRNEPREIVAFLTDTRYKVDAFFYLAGPLVYLEVIFWSLFGVLASLLYYVSDAERKKDEEFDPAQIPYQKAKMFYAPLATLVLVLGYSMIAGENLVDIDAGKGMIVFAFLAGFYSGRTMNFLDRLKEFLLPGIESESKISTKSGKGSKVAAVGVNLLLDPTGLTDQQQKDIAQAGFKQATITLTPKAGGNDITLVAPTDDKGHNFTGKDIPFGTYTMKTAFTVKDDAGVVLQFNATQEVDIKQPQHTFEIKIRKSEDQG